MVPVRLTGPRLAIREFHHTPGDIEALYAVFGDPVATRHLPFGPYDRESCADQVAQYLEEALRDERTVYRLAVTLRADGTDSADPADGGAPIGSAALTLGEHRSAVLGYALRPDTWGHGYAGEITGLLCDLAFGTLGVHRLAARVDVDNTASSRVLTRAGFQLEGRIRHDLHLRDTWYDSFQYSLLADEWAGAGTGAGQRAGG
ncbi:GNAT family N-acetyltransferase [Kitasatospora sp. NPDC088548]|uniref:GNAT family N-acetyltransferase n=1 Tax=Kitasatospora sp. NPDC088548 TaxID=3364075 RepID=UPI0037FEC808